VKLATELEKVKAIYAAGDIKGPVRILSEA